MNTALFASILGFIYVFLSLNVIRLRWKERVSIGDAGVTKLKVAIRVHANFIEYVPLALILLFFLEILFGYEKTVIGLGSILILSRIMHAIGMTRVNGASIGRSGGMVLTFGVILVASLLILFRFIR